MSEQSLNIFSLETAIGLLANKPNIESLKPAEISFISKAHNLFLNHYSDIHPDSNCPAEFEDLNYFAKNNDSNDLKAITSFLSQTTEGKKQETTKEVNKQDSSIPVELEAMVALYKQHQADLVDNEKPNSLAENIKRAQKTVNERRKYDLIRENASKENQKELDKQKERSDQLYSQTIDPKLSRSEITKNTRNLASYILLAQSRNLNTSQYSEAIEQIVYLAETGGLDVTDPKSLYEISNSIVNNYTKENKELAELNSLAEERYKAEEQGLATNDYDKKIDSLAEFVEDKNKAKQEAFAERLKNPDKNITPIDPDVLMEQSAKEIGNITEKLSKRFPNAKDPYQETDFLAQNAKKIERAVLATDRTALSVSPVGLGARTAATLKETGSKVINPVVVDLYSRGLTADKYKQLTADKNSPLSLLLNKNQNLRKRIENGLKVYGTSPDGQTIAGQLKPVSKFESYLPNIVQKALHPVKTIEASVNKRLGEFAGKKLNSTFGKSLGGKLEKYILKDGLKEGAKNLANKAAVKLISAGAKQLGVQGAKLAGIAAADSAIAATAAALGVSTAGLSLVIGAVLILGERVMSFGFNKFKELYKDIWGEEFDGKKVIGAVALGGAAIWGTLNVANKSFRFLGVATKAAAFSAVGIIWLSIATIAVFLTLTFLTAPILSTLVQFDSIEKVKYGEFVTSTSSGECGWPIEPGYKVQSGPGGGTHQMSSLEAIDIFGDAVIDKKPIYSSTDGVVTTDGNYSNYGHTIIIQTTNSAGSFEVIYGHVSSSNVTVGKHVKKGDKIGTVGSTEIFTNPHLHFEYKGINGASFKYNQCPAGGVKVKEGCADFVSCGSIITGSGPNII